MNAIINGIDLGAVAGINCDVIFLGVVNGYESYGPGDHIRVRLESGKVVLIPLAVGYLVDGDGVTGNLTCDSPEVQIT